LILLELCSAEFWEVRGMRIPDVITEWLRDRA
jgi:hypothetical protein